MGKWWGMWTMSKKPFFFLSSAPSANTAPVRGHNIIKR